MAETPGRPDAGSTSPQEDRRQATGALGERIAAGYLAGLGWEIVARNWRTRAGELDLVALDGAWLVFVEVRARRAAPSGRSLTAGPPEESVTPRKQAQLARMAAAYVFETSWAGPWRIDVIALELRPDGSVARLNHLRDAIGGAGW